MEQRSIQSLAERIKENVSKVIIGKDEVVEKLLIAAFCGGHVLLEDIPGTGKTSLAKAIARSLDCRFARVQFTPDLLPSDITGINIYNQKQEEFVLKKGPVFTNILLGDEINRATPRTQSSLLECMEERQATIDGVTYPLEAPFWVIATQNPIETQGTFVLPEAQLDRFFVKLSMGYPAPDKEQEILDRYIRQSPLESLAPVASREELVQVQQAVREVTVSDPVQGYIVALANATRKESNIQLGVSPRGSLALLRASQGCAAVHGRDYVLPDDVKEMAIPVLAHRIILRGGGLLRQQNATEDVIRNILSWVEAPIV